VNVTLSYTTGELQGGRREAVQSGKFDIEPKWREQGISSSGTFGKRATKKKILWNENGLGALRAST